ncbi:MAG TPA: protein DpdD [Microthrixaceae bacterium]|nr:protein DpdD [Microthrixaceae bacterium]
MSAEVEAFLGSFFGPGNDLSVADLAASNPTLAEWLDGRIAALRESPDSPTLLPRRRGDALAWYGIARTKRERRELAQVLQAFVGPTYATLRVDRPLDPHDSIDVATTAFAEQSFTIDVLSGEQAAMRRALDLYFDLAAIRPRRTIAVSRPLGRLLREFEMAVVAGSGGLSAELLAEIESSGQLSAQNLVFLRVRRLSGLRLDRDVLDLPELATILSIRRPVRVTAALFDAVYTTELAHFEAEADAIGALDHFSSTVLPRYPALFRSRQGLQTSAAVKTYALYTALAHPEDRFILTELAESTDLLAGERSYIDAIAKLVAPADEVGPTLSGAVDAVHTGRFDAALALARDLPSTVERAELLMRCAIEIDSLDAMRVARSAVDSLDEADRLSITGSRLYSVPWERFERILSGATAEPAPSNWCEWFQQAATTAPFDLGLELAERSVVEWTSDALSSADSRAISDLLNQDLDPTSLRQIKDALPHFLQFIERVAEPTEHRSLLDDLSTLLLIDDDPSVADIAVTVTLIGTILEIGTAADRRRELVHDFIALHARVDSAAHLDAALDLFDIVLTFAAADTAPREASFAMLLNALQRWRRRVRPDQWLIARDLAAEAGAAAAVGELVPAEEVELEDTDRSQRDALRGKTVAIYTLTESAAVRARDFLLRNFDDVDVVLSSARVASDQLASLAKSADVFVIATRSAKHAATTFIEAQRPPNRPPAYAAGKGSVSLIRAALAGVTLAG